MSEENMTMSHLMFERLVFDVEHDKKKFKRAAVKALAKKILESGCLIHQSEYDIERNMTHEVITVYTLKREKHLP